MIITEQYKGNSNLIRRYSDQGYMLLQEQTGIEYSEAIDLVSSNYTYSETDHPISDFEYAERFSIVRLVQDLQNNIQTLTETNDMLTECVLEMSELIYE